MLIPIFENRKNLSISNTYKENIFVNSCKIIRSSRPRMVDGYTYHLNVGFRK